MSRILFAAKHVQTVLRMSKPLFVSSGGLLANGKEEKNASNDNKGYSINSFEKLSCKKKSTVFETLFITTGKPCVLDGITPTFPS